MVEIGFAGGVYWHASAGSSERGDAKVSTRRARMKRPRGMILWRQPRRGRQVARRSSADQDAVDPRPPHGEASGPSNVPGVPEDDDEGSEGSTFSTPDLVVTLDGLKRPRRAGNVPSKRPTPRAGSEQRVMAAIQCEPRTVRSYLLYPSPKAFDLHRRAWKGDPFYPAAELRRSSVWPGTKGAELCSDPRPSGRLREWIHTARSTGLIESPKDDAALAEQFVRRSEDQSKVIVVGDVHGCIDELQRLLILADFAPGDQVIFLGDLVAKGPASLEVVQLGRKINARACRGNHDHKVISWRLGVAKNAPLEDVPREHREIAESLAKEDVQWLLSNPWFITYPELSMIFVHAGVEPGTPMAKQRPHMMMNMRSITGRGKATTRRGSESWASSWRGPETVVFGHDASRGLQRYPRALGIDSACVHGGRLTALLLPERRLISVPARKEYRALH